MKSAVELEGVWWRYPSYSGSEHPWILTGINLKVEQGQVLGVTGQSGSGKTTLCRIMLGILPHGTKIPMRRVNHHMKGKVSIHGNLVTEIDPTANVVEGEPLGAIHGRGVPRSVAGLVMQDPENQFLQMSVFHELAFGMSLLGLDRQAIIRRAHDSLARVGLGELWKGAEFIHPMDLSGGQKQRIAIAAFLALDPDVLILDEPTSDLDPQGKREIVDTVRQLREDGATIVLVEHDPEILYEFCDRIILLGDGKIVSDDTPSTFFRNYDFLNANGISVFEVSRIANESGIHDGTRVPLEIPELLPLVSPGGSGWKTSAIPKASGRSVARVRGLKYRYDDGTLALDGADMELATGEMVALLGMNGSGKTTLAKVLAGIYEPQDGQVELFGRDVRSKEFRRALPSRVGYVFQNPDHQLFTRRVYDEVSYGLENIGVPHGERDEIIRHTLEIVGLSGHIEEDPLFLGKGQRQRLAVAAVLAMEPEFLIVDEPTTGQDFGMMLGIMSLLDRIHQQGKTILIITHDMRIVGRHCPRSVVLAQGRTVFDGATRELFRDSETLRLTYLRAPQAARLSLAVQRKHPDFPMLISSDEWIEYLRHREAQVH